MDRHICIGMVDFDLIDQRFGHIVCFLKIILTPDLNMKIKKQLVTDHPASKTMRSYDRRMMPENKHSYRIKLGI